jgi:iron complex outermembrane receptor protein
MTKSNTRVQSTVLAGVLSVSVPLLATAADATDDNIKTASSTGAITLEEVVVTATKRPESIQTVPSAITAITSGLMDRVQAQDLSDLAAYVPGLNVQSSGVDANRLVIRGLTTGPNDLSPSVGVYVDDAPFGSNSGFALGALFSPDVDPSDLERVEVLRGPQGTLYGASTLAGLVKYVTKAPDTEDFSVHARVDYGHADGTGVDTYAVRAGANLPILTDKIALRLSGFYENSDGYLTDVRTDASGLNGAFKHGGRIDLLLKPIDDLSINLIAFTDTSQTARIGQIDGNPQTLQPVYGENSGFNPVIGSARSSYDVYQATVRYDFAGGYNLTSTTSYSHFAVDEVADDTGIFEPALGPFLGPLLEFPGVVAPTTQKYTEELRMASPTNDTFEWLTGVFYDQERSDYVATINSTYLYGATPPAILVPTVDALANYEDTDTLTHYMEYAGFADVTYHVIPQFDLDAGLRYSHNSQDRTTTAAGLLALTGVIPAYGHATSSDGVWTESAAARWHLNEQSMLYARYSTGYRPGGPNTAGGAFSPDTTRNYELGFKTSGLGGVLRADLSVYYIDWRDIQLNFFNGTNTVIGNAGNAHSKGAEFQTTYAPVHSFSLQANAAYSDAFISSLNPGAQGGAAVGDQLPGNSKWTGALLADYFQGVTSSLEWNAGAGLRYKSSFNTTFPGDTGTRFYTLPSTTFVDLRTGLSFKSRYTLTLQVLNVANQRKLSTASEYLAVSHAVADAAGQPVLLGYTPGRMLGLSFLARY